jgi:Family of unknown function (DUF6502)
MKRLPKAKKSVLPPRGIGYSREFLERLARILVRTGHSPKKLVQEFREVCGDLKEPRTDWDPSFLEYLADLPHVIAHWHADPQYLDSDGNPAPLRLRGHGRNLATLVARVLPGRDVGAVIDSLMRLRGIRRRGPMYVPTNRQLILNNQGESARVHGLMALLGILRTLEHNVSPGNSRGKILERTAVNPRFPVRALPEFHRRLERLAADFLWSADGNMRRREARSTSEPAIRLGVGVFAFEDPLVTGTRKSTQPQQATAARRGRLGRRITARSR